MGGRRAHPDGATNTTSGTSGANTGITGRAGPGGTRQEDGPAGACDHIETCRSCTHHKPSPSASLTAPMSPLWLPHGCQPHRHITPLWKVCRDFLLAAGNVLTTQLLACSLASPGSPWLLCIKTFLYVVLTQCSSCLFITGVGNTRAQPKSPLPDMGWRCPYMRRSRATLGGVPCAPRLLPAGGEETQSRMLAEKPSKPRSISSPVTGVAMAGHHQPLPSVRRGVEAQ